MNENPVDCRCAIPLGASRRTINKILLKQALGSILEVRPGNPEYLKFARALLPLEVPLGENHQTGDNVVWMPGNESNGFLMVLGASGSGKTETLKTVGHAIAAHAIPILVLDFHGDVVFPGVNSVLISSGTASTVGINPMELDWQGISEVGFEDQIHALLETITRAVPIKHRQSTLLAEAFTEAYRQAGFHPEYPDTWRLPPPTFSSVVNVLMHWRLSPERKHEKERIASCIDAIRGDFRHVAFNRYQNLSIDDLLRFNIRADLSKLPDAVRFIVADTLLRRVFRAMRLRGPVPVGADDAERFRLFIMIDEAKLLSMGKGDVDDSRQILNILMTEGRKFGIGLIVASQMADHFGNEARGSAATWLVMKPMDMAEAKRNAPNVMVAPDVVMQLQGRGDAFLRTSSMPGVRRIQVRALPAAREEMYAK